MTTLLLILTLLLIFYISDSTIILYDPLNTTNSHYISWTIDGTEVDAPTTFKSLCPDTSNGCWRFVSSSQAYHMASTLNYVDLTLTYTVLAADLDNNDQCAVYYSTDNSNWILLGEPYTTNDVSSTITISLPSNTFDNTIGIKLASENNDGDSFDYCFFSDIILKGQCISCTNPNTESKTEPPSNNGLIYGLISAAVILVCCLILAIVICVVRKRNDAVKTTQQLEDTVTNNTNKIDDDNDKIQTETNNDRNVNMNERTDKNDINSLGITIEIEKESDNESEDSIYRKQQQYALDEECGNNNNNNNNNNDTDLPTPIPTFESHVSQQVSSQNVLMDNIMNDMQKSQLRLETEKNQ